MNSFKKCLLFVVACFLTGVPFYLAVMYGNPTTVIQIETLLAFPILLFSVVTAYLLIITLKLREYLVKKQQELQKREELLSKIPTVA